MKELGIMEGLEMTTGTGEAAQTLKCLLGVGLGRCLRLVKCLLNKQEDLRESQDP